MDGDSTQKPNTPVPCANQCGFFGNPLTANFCSKCHRDINQNKKPDEEKTAKPISEIAGPKPSDSKSSETSNEETQPAKKVQTDTSKCFSCSKKIGLLGFKCRCDYTFCSSHRYSDKHDCSYDYKTAGKAALAKANPVVQGSKITKI